VRARFVSALDYGLRAGGGHGEHNAVALQRAVNDLAVAGGTILIPAIMKLHLPSVLPSARASGARRGSPLLGARARS